MISTGDIRQAVGFIEGEGSFSWFSGPIVQVSQVQKWPLVQLQILFGGSLTRRPSKNKRHSPIYLWRLCGPRSVGLMLTLYKHLSPKRRKRIRQILGRWKKAPGHGHAGLRTSCKRGHPFSSGNTYLTTQWKTGGPKRACKTCQRTVFNPQYEIKRRDLRKH